MLRKVLTRENLRVIREVGWRNWAIFTASLLYALLVPRMFRR